MLNFFRNHKKLSIFLILFFIGFVLYGNTFNNKFFWDDDDSIVNNVYIKNWDYFDKYFTENLIAGSGQVTDYWRPVLLISFALDYHLWGLDPFGFHFTNMLLHILCAWLIFLFLRDIVNLQQQFDGAQRECERESTRISASDTSMYRFQLSKEKSFILPFLVSLIFLIHPLQTEAVAYAAGRAEPLSTIFVLLAVLMYLEWRGYAFLVSGFYGDAI